MSHRTRWFSTNRTRDRADEIETAAATAYFDAVKADIAAHRDEPLGGPDAVDDEACANDETTRLPAVPVPYAGLARRPFVQPVGRGWDELFVRENTDALRARYLESTAAAAEDQAPAVEQLPELRRRHLPAVGAWFAEHLRPVPRPAIPDAARFRVVPLEQLAEPEPDPEQAPAEASPLEQAEWSGDFVAWLRAEFADTYAMCEAAIVAHAADAQADLDDLGGTYFQRADLALAELNTMTLPGWTDLENAYLNTGVFAS